VPCFQKLIRIVGSLDDIHTKLKEFKKKEPPLNHDDHGSEPAKGQFLVYQAEDGKLKLDVRFEDESVWLTQQLMADRPFSKLQSTLDSAKNVSLALEFMHDKNYDEADFAGCGWAPADYGAVAGESKNTVMTELALKF